MNVETSAHEFMAMITSWGWLLIFLVWVGMHTVQERFSEFFTKPKLGWRMLPFMPSIVCCVCCFIPGPWIPPEATAPMRLLFGTLLGVIAYNFGGVANRLGLGKILDAMGVKLIVDSTRPKKDRENQQNPPLDLEK